MSTDKKLKVPTTNNPQVIDWHMESSDGQTWHKAPGRIIARIGGKRVDTDPNIETLFNGIVSLAQSSEKRELRTKLSDCRHKLYAANYHFQAIEREIDLRVKEFLEKQQANTSGVGLELDNPVLIYETEAFLFQVKSNLDLITQCLHSIVPRLKSLDSFKHKGTPGSPDYIAGGKVIAELERSQENELVDLLRNHVLTWITQMTTWRNAITHHSRLRDFHCFIEEPYSGNMQTNVHYPTMPSGERVDVYFQQVYSHLYELYREVFRIIEQRIAKPL